MVKDSLFTILFRVFSRIVWGSEEEWIRRKRLKETTRLLRTRHPNWINGSMRRIEPGFAQSLYRLALICRRVSEEYPQLQCIERSEEGQRELLESLLKAWLDPSAWDAFAAVEYEQMKTELEEQGNNLSELSRLEQRYLEASEVFHNGRLTGFYEGYCQLLLLSDLLQFDFKGMIGSFDPSFSMGNRKYLPAFSAVPADQLEDDLLDLYYLWKRFNVSLSLEKHLKALKSETSEEEDSLLSSLKRFTEEEISLEDAEQLLQLLKGDPDVELLSAPLPDNPLEKLQQDLQRNFELSRERLEREIIEKKIMASVDSLFGKEGYSDVPGYTSLISRHFFEKGFTGYLYALPLALIDTSLKRFYREHMPDEFHKILRDGLFPDPGFAKKISDLLQGLERLRHALQRLPADLERLRVEDRSLKSDDILQILECPEHNGNRVLIEGYVKEANRRAKQLVDGGSSLFLQLRDVSSAVLRDAKRKKPQLVANIEHISGEHCCQSQEALERSENKMNHLLDILKHYTVIHF